MKYLHHQPVIWTLALGLISLPAYAQFVEEVEVIGRNVNLVGSATAASQGRVSHQELSLRPLLRTGEVLEVVPGLVATQHSGSGKANQFFLRGFNLDHGTDFATFVDGMPVNMRSHGHGQGYTDINFLIPEMIEEITFRKGGYYADVGDFSGTGAARISSVEHLEGNRLSLGLGEYGFRRALLAGDVENPLGDMLYALEWQGYDGPWDDLDEGVDKTNLWLKQRWQGGRDSLQFTLMAYENAWRSADQIPARAVEGGLISEFGSIDPTVGGHSTRYSLSANWARTLDSGALSANAYVVDYDMALWSNFSYFTAPEGDQFRQVDDRRLYGGDLQWRQAGQLGDFLMENRVGIDYRFDDIDRVGLERTQQRRYLADIRMDAVEQWSTGLFWENELQWNDHWRSLVGLRYDYHDFSVNPLAANAAASLVANRGGDDEDIITANASLMYAPDDRHEFYVSAGQGYHSNDARGVTIALDPVAGTPVASADPLIDTLGAELGMRSFLTDRLNASFALWYLEIDSELLFVGDAGNTEDTGVGSRRHGLEMTAYYRLSPWWTLDVEYSWTDARLDSALEGSREIPGALEHVLSGGVNLRLNDRFNAYLRLRHFEDYPLDGGERADASTMLNLRMAWEVSEQLDLSLDLLNLLDSRDRDISYFYESQLPGEAAAVGDEHYHVFEARSVRAYATWRF